MTASLKSCLTALAFALAAPPALAADPAADTDTFDPARLELADIIACKVTAREWTGFSLWFYDNDEAHRRYGMTALKSDNPFLSQYHLAQPINAWGHATSQVAFTSSGLMAVLDGIAARDLADAMGVGPVIDFPGKFLGEKVVAERPFDGGSPIFQGTERITLNVSTVSDLPGKVLAGCSYRIDFPD